MTEDASLFIWSRFDNWSPRVIEWFKEIVPYESWDTAGQDPRMYFALTEDSNADAHSDATGQLSRKFKEAYSGIRLFHACRPSDIGSYLEKGLLPLSTEDADKVARARFLTDKLTGVSERALSDAFAGLSREHRGGYLYLSLDDTALVNHARHYLIYGSEYLAGIASSLSRCTGVDCLAALRDVGTPTVFVCDVPVGHVPESTVQSLVQELISRAILDRGFPKGEAYAIDFTFTFTTHLPASVINTHYHPSRIPDRIRGGVHANPRTSCPSCAVPGRTHVC